MKQVLFYACQKTSFLTYTLPSPSKKKASAYLYGSNIITTVSAFNAAERFANNLNGDCNA